MKWRKHPPLVDEINPEEYWWVRGHPFNRPVIVRVCAGARRKLAGGFEAEVNFTFFADNFERITIWRDALGVHGLDGLEWAGPIAHVETDNAKD